ncbi:MAG: NAD(P)H-quinone oxidoreductase [Candidatus Eremiobacteraeota bacterium]|nr:NAD(P)H-quinone oxidoreductase [Candidatus Eremiobacteraeota bacterium]
MKFVAFQSPGDPGVLTVREGPVPKPGAGEVTIEVEAAGVSRADALQRAGKYPPPPGASPVLGLEVSGIVAETGEGVVDVSAGDRVCALCNGGGYAEYVCVPVGCILPLPEEWSFIEGATLPENSFTVFDAVLLRAKLQRGETLLVHGGTSGIGTTAIAYGLAMGACVIATAGSRKKCDAILELGAAAAINYRTSDFVAAVRDVTNGRGADVVLDIIGGDYINRDLNALAIEGRIACIATPRGSEATIDLRTLFARRATIFGSSLRPRSNDEKAAIASGLRSRIWPLLGKRDPIVPVVDSVFPFSDAKAAHERLESSEHIGKIVLVPDAARPE